MQKFTFISFRECWGRRWLRPVNGILSGLVEHIQASVEPGEGAWVDDSRTLSGIGHIDTGATKLIH